MRLQITGVINGTGSVDLGAESMIAGTYGNLSGGVMLNPDKNYQLTLFAAYSEATIILTPPDGYRIFIDGSERKRIQVSSTDPSSTTTEVFDIRLSVTGAGNNPGTATGISPGDIDWGVSLGRTYNGSSAGSLAIRKASIETTVFNRGVLEYSGINQQTGIVRDQNGFLRQILAPETFVDITDLPDETGFKIAFYAPSACGFSTEQPYPVVDGSHPYITYTINAPTVAGAPLDISWNDNANVVMTSVTADSSITAGEQLPDEIVIEARSTGILPDGRHIETITLQNGSGAVAQKIHNIYKIMPWNDEQNDTPGTLVEEILNPDGGSANSPGRPLRTIYDYYENTEEIGRYKRLKSITFSNGDWIEYDYYADFARFGCTKIETRPWLDGTTALRTAEYDYSSDWDGAQIIVTSREEKIGGITTSKLTATETLNQSANGLKYWMYIQTLDGGSAGTLTTIAKLYQASQDASMALNESFKSRANRNVYNNLPYSIEQPGGSKISYAYQRGNIDFQDNFVAVISFDDDAAALKEISLEGLGDSISCDGAVLLNWFFKVYSG